MEQIRYPEEIQRDADEYALSRFCRLKCSMKCRVKGCLAMAAMWDRSIAHDEEAPSFFHMAGSW